MIVSNDLSLPSLLVVHKLKKFVDYKKGIDPTSSFGKLRTSRGLRTLMEALDNGL